MRMKERVNGKLNACKGFTLGETLLAVLILLLVSAVVASGIPNARNAYEKVVLASNAEMLLSTTITSLRNELGTSQDIRTPPPKDGEAAEADTILTYFNPNRGASSKLYVDSGGSEGIMLQRYYIEDGESGTEYPADRLISREIATGDLYVTYTSVDYDDGLVTFRGLAVKRASGSELASRDTLSIRVISE